MSKVEVKESKIKGKGLFAARPIAKGEAILRIDDSAIVHRDDPFLGKLIGSEPDPCDYLPDGRIILMQHPERYINHGCEPNVYIFTLGQDRFILAMRDIGQGEELLYDYAIGVVGGDWLDCSCGSRKCRGRHRSDFFSLSVAEQLEYLPYLSAPFVLAHWQRIFELLQSQAEGSFQATQRTVPVSHELAPAERVEIRAKIRPSEPADAQALKDLDSVVPIDPTRADFIDKWLREEKVVVAEIGDQVIGYGVINHYFFHQSQVEMLMVAPRYRGRRIGEQLLTELEQLCDTSKLFVTTNLSNRRMQRLLLRTGYAQCGYVAELDAGDPELVFVKKIRMGSPR